eukprot:g1008.t1
MCEFDGKCELCEDGDIILRFDDDSTLLAHSLILRKASPILKTALTECEIPTVLKLPAISRHIWVFILRELYPTQSYLSPDMFTVENEVDIIAFGKECEKYGIVSMLSIMDVVIVNCMEKILTNHAEWKNDLCLFANLVAHFDLPLSKGRVVSHTLHAMKGIVNRPIYSRSYCRSQIVTDCDYPDSMIQAIQYLMDADLEKWNGKFCRSILHDVLKIPLDTNSNMME